MGGLKGPPSFSTFYPDGTKERCTQVSLDLIQQSSFLFPPTVPGVSFQFAERKLKGTVLNGKKATVGDLMGDGSKLTFSFPQRFFLFLFLFKFCFLLLLFPYFSLLSFKIKLFPYLSLSIERRPPKRSL